jgi:hypothetical protein
MRRKAVAAGKTPGSSPLASTALVPLALPRTKSLAVGKPDSTSVRNVAVADEAYLFWSSRLLRAPVCGGYQNV